VPREPDARTTALANRLHSLAIHLLRTVRASDEESGLSAPRLSALSVIVFREPITLGDLAAAEGVTAPTMTRLVQGLEADKLLGRHAHPTDARAVLLRPTERGRRLLAAARKRRVKTLASALAHLETKDRNVVALAVSTLEALIRR